MAETVERAHHHEVAHGAGPDGSAAQAVQEIVEGPIGAALALGDDCVPALLTKVAHVFEADAHGVLGLNRQGSHPFQISIRFAAVCRLGEGTGPVEVRGPRGGG